MITVKVPSRLGSTYRDNCMLSVLDAGILASGLKCDEWFSSTLGIEKRQCYPVWKRITKLNDSLPEETRKPIFLWLLAGLPVTLDV